MHLRQIPTMYVDTRLSSIVETTTVWHARRHCFKTRSHPQRGIRFVGGVASNVLGLGRWYFSPNHWSNCTHHATVSPAVHRVLGSAAILLLLDCPPAHISADLSKSAKQQYATSTWSTSVVVTRTRCSPRCRRDQSVQVTPSSNLPRGLPSI